MTMRLALRHFDWSVLEGEVRFAPAKAAWFGGMLLAVLILGPATFSIGTFTLFALSTGLVLLLGHSLGSHRKLVHESFDCPRWLEYLLVYCGMQVGIAGPIGLLRQHDLRDFAQRQPSCHAYLRHGVSPWKDAWWQLCCELHLRRPPQLSIAPRVAGSRFYRALERSWMLQHLPWAAVLYACGGLGGVVWGVCARVVAGNFGHWLIGHLAHNHGDVILTVEGAAVQGRNVRFTSLLTMGECWHNNHHAFPDSAQLGLRPGEWDPGWWVLLALRRCGLVSNLRVPAVPPSPIPAESRVLA